MKYFLHDPWSKLQIFTDEQEWKAAVYGYDFVGNYCDDGWSEEVENVTAGCIPDDVAVPDFFEEDIDIQEWLEPYTTLSAQMCDEQKRPDDVGADGYSGEEYWGDWDYICNYKFLPVAKGAAYEQ